MSLARNTIFALIMAIEADFRRLVSSTLDDDPLSVAEADLARRRLIADRRAEVATDWRQLLPYTDLDQLLQVIDRHRAEVAAGLACNEDDLAAIVRKAHVLVPIRNRVCHARPLEPEDLATTVDCTDGLAASDLASSFSEVAEVRTELATARTYPLTLDIPAFWRIDEQVIDNNLPPPEWDDTGFVGRTRDRENVLRLLLGAYPVITVTGEGGVGKTALAIRCLYDLLDRRTQFDAILWTSLKVARLTAGGIRDVLGAMQSEVDVLASVAARFGDNGTTGRDELFETVLEIMNQFRVLLVIDNLETLDRDAFRPLFLGVPRDSKILTTSRVGIGEFEARYPLQPMDAPDAVTLLRRTAKLFNAQDLYRREDAELREVTQKLFHSPLAIRWFVQSYSEGRSVKGLLDGRRSADDLLRFCFQNLYETLSEEQVEVLRVLVALGKPLSDVQLALLLATRDVERIRNSVHYLYASNLLVRARDTWSAEGAPLWTVSEFARRYIIARDKHVSAERLRLLPQYNALTAARDAARTASAANSFKTSVINAQSTDEATVVRGLSEALKATRAGEYAQALDHVRRSAELLPGFYEVWRVSAQVKEYAGDVIGATEDFERALELAEGRSQPLLVFYAIFLAKYGQFEQAVNLLSGPAAQEDATFELVATFAWMQTLSGRLRDAVETFGSIHAELFEVGGRARSMYVTQFAETLRRAAETDWSRGRLAEAVQQTLQAIAVIQEAVAAGMQDAKMVDVAQECVDQACRLIAARCSKTDWDQLVMLARPLHAHIELVGRFTSGIRRLRDNCGAISGSPAFRDFFGRYVEMSELGTERIVGTVTRVSAGRDYTFIKSTDGQTFYFHRGQLASAYMNWDDLCRQDGVRVRFGAVPSPDPSKAPSAVHVVPLHENIAVDSGESADVLVSSVDGGPVRGE